MKFQRRKVVSSRRPHIGHNSHNYFECTLACGHVATAYGIKPKGEYTPQAPKTCECRRCPAKETK